MSERLSSQTELSSYNDIKRNIRWKCQSKRYPRRQNERTDGAKSNMERLVEGKRKISTRTIPICVSVYVFLCTMFHRHIWCM